MYDVGKENTEKDIVRAELDTLYEKFVAKNKQAEGRASGSSAKNNCNGSTSMPLMDYDYMGSLKPEMVEALVRGASYNKGSHKDFNLVERDEDEEDDVENIKLPKIVDTFVRWIVEVNVIVSCHFLCCDELRIMCLL
ncbi:uncharacterized protein LOC123440232 [Hordeum vulgare subsp. vulgare]|uniref:uncharacterized protein LOC123440232 n=1 Tax=Hordeum vulgare subsp. vulgare TaxID=112509 RepID=UPI001D1A4CA9|nr:uncharacterized protein LOC123440232 [Hordeum vulgare subsp. vulgare]